MSKGTWDAVSMAEQAGLMPKAPAKVTAGSLAQYWHRLVRDVLTAYTPTTPDDRRRIKRYEAALGYLKFRAERC